jgi:hypothetical protein
MVRNAGYDVKPDDTASPQALFQAVEMHHGGVSDSPRLRGFGKNALKVNGKIFAALTKDRLLLKLPKERVDALIAANLAERFSTGTGRPKKEWVTISPSSKDHWVKLSDEALEYVSLNSNT